MDVSIIIVNYNTQEITSNCIQSIIDRTEEILYEIIIIDNASTDDSLECFEKKYHSLILIKNKLNIGFGAACNQGLEIARGKYSFFLNSDTLLENNAIKMFFDFCETNMPKIKFGVIGSLLLDINENLNQSFDTFLSPKRALWDLFYPYLVRLKLINKKQHQKVIFEKGYLAVDYIIGADMFVNTNLVRTYNGFDPIFFMYYEETDLQYRLFSNGYNSLLIEGPQIIHLEGSSENKKSNNKQLILNHSVFKYLRKHYRLTSVYFVKSIFFVLYFFKLIDIRNLSRNYKYLKSVLSY